jgi:hypothetical protein
VDHRTDVHFDHHEARVHQKWNFVASRFGTRLDSAAVRFPFLKKFMARAFFFCDVYPKFRYPTEIHAHLLQLLKKFEICYDVPATMSFKESGVFHSGGEDASEESGSLTEETKKGHVAGEEDPEENGRASELEFTSTEPTSGGGGLAGSWTRQAGNLVPRITTEILKTPGPANFLRNTSSRNLHKSVISHFGGLVDSDHEPERVTEEQGNEGRQKAKLTPVFLKTRAEPLTGASLFPW